MIQMIIQGVEMNHSDSISTIVYYQKIENAQNLRVERACTIYIVVLLTAISVLTDHYG